MEKREGEKKIKTQSLAGDMVLNRHACVRALSLPNHHPRPFRGDSLQHTLKVMSYIIGLGNVWSLQSGDKPFPITELRFPDPFSDHSTQSFCNFRARVGEPWETQDLCFAEITCNQITLLSLAIRVSP